MQVIAHNILSQFTNRQLNINSKGKSKATEKLSTGYRINRSADDAAGLSISEKMRGQIRGLHQASENIQDGISLCQVADGALNETQAILQRMRELSVQSANDTNAEADRQAIQKEIEELTKEVDRIANETEFNEGILPLKGTSNIDGGISTFGWKLPEYLSIRELTVKNTTGQNVKWDGVYYKPGEIYKVKYALYNGTKHENIPHNYFVGMVSDKNGIYGNGQSDLYFLDSAMVSNSKYGGGYSITSWEVESDGTIYFNSSNGKSVWFALKNSSNKWQWDIASGVKDNSIDYYVKAINEGKWIQMGANSGQGMFLNLVDATAKGVGITDPTLDVTNFSRASHSISRLDGAINKVNFYRSYFGAQQNRLEHGQLVDDNTAENLQSSESRIRDTDIASEMVNYSKSSILEQAGQAMLAQANQLPQNVLNLFK